MFKTQWNTDWYNPLRDAPKVSFGTLATRQAVYDALVDGHKRVKTIAALLGASPTTVRKQLVKLERDGHIYSYRVAGVSSRTTNYEIKK